jgi:hypothetical protein
MPDDPELAAWKAERDALKRKVYRPWVIACLAFIGLGLALVAASRLGTMWNAQLADAAIVLCWLGAACAIIGSRIWRRKLLALTRKRQGLEG